MSLSHWFAGIGARMSTKDTEAPKADLSHIDPAVLERVITNAGLGRTLALMGSTRRVLWRQFLSGMIWGIGYFVGLTLGVALLVWGLAQVTDFPVIGEYAGKFKDIIDSYTPPISQSR